MTDDPKKFEVGATIKAVVPRNATELHMIASELCNANVVPHGLNGQNRDETISKVSVAIMQGLEVGFGPMRSMATIAVINGRPTIYGDGVTALLQNSGVMSGMKISEIGDKPEPGAANKDWPDTFGISVELMRRNHDEPYIGEFTVDDARRAGLWLNPKRKPWMQYPKRMLKWRALGFAARDGFGDCLAGMMIREEVEDLPRKDEKATVDAAFLEDRPVIEEIEDARGEPKQSEIFPGDLPDGETVGDNHD